MRAVLAFSDRVCRNADISEVAKYANPPTLVKLVIEALCVMFNIPPAKVGEAGKKVDDYW